MKKFLLSLMLMFTGLVAMAQVTWDIKIQGNGTDHPAVVMTAKIAPGYHLYDINNPKGGSEPLVINFDNLKGVKLDGRPKANKSYHKEFDDVFEVDQYFYDGSVTFTQKLIPTADKFSLEVDLKGQACNDSGCTRTTKFVSLNGTAPAKAAAAATPAAPEATAAAATPATAEAAAEVVVAEEAAAAPETLGEMVDSVANLAATDSLAVSEEAPVLQTEISDDIYKNVEAELNKSGDKSEDDNRGILYIFIAGFIGGLIALVTPCVWPMIPMTVSFFLKQNKDRRKAITTAIIYGLSIIVIYVALGLIVTLIFGASALNALSTSALFNIIFFLLLCLFAFSFMGGFELTLPASWTNKMDSKVDSTTGYLAVFFMAFTLVLVSFSCTGPIIGTLLVEAASSGNFMTPLVGMFGFSLALAIPFALFAMFPTMLNSMPNSGGWMNTVKVVLGFLELALSLKFLSVADLAYGWHILDREVFVSLWIVIFACLGFYLLGKIRFPHDDEVEKVSVTRYVLATISLAFAVYMVPGLWGAPLKAISAFAPPTNTQDFSLYEGDVAAKTHDFEEGLRLSQETGKPVLLDFSGFGCVNCRKMEGAVWTDPDVKAMLDNDYIVVELMVDDKTMLPEPLVKEEKNGEQVKLRTIGDKWSWLQRSKFGKNSQPFHVIVDANGMPLAGSFEYKEDVPGYKEFLERGIKNNEKSKKGEMKY